MRRVRVLLLVGAVVLALAACSPSSAERGSRSDRSDRSSRDDDRRRPPTTADDDRSDNSDDRSDNSDNSDDRSDDRSDDDGESEGSGSGGQLQSKYTGSAEVTVERTDICTGGTTTEVYDEPAEVLLDEPHTVEGITEENPVHFVITLGQPVEPGSISLVSAQSFNSETLDGTPGPVLLPYWESTLEDGRFSGELTNSWTSAGAVLNFIGNSEPLIPCTGAGGDLTNDIPKTLEEGAQMSGELGSEGAELVLDAVSRDQSLRIHAEIAAR